MAVWVLSSSPFPLSPPIPLTTERAGGFVPRYHFDPSVDGIQSEVDAKSHGSKWPNAAQTCSLPSSPPPHPPIHPSLTTERAGGLVPRHHPDPSIGGWRSTGGELELARVKVAELGTNLPPPVDVVVIIVVEIGPDDLHGELRLAGVAAEAVLEAGDAVHDPVVDDLVDVVHDVLREDGVESLSGQLLLWPRDQEDARVPLLALSGHYDTIP